MQFTIYQIKKIISEPPKEVWLNFLDKALLSVKEYSKEIEFAALQFEDLRAEVDKMAETFALRVDVNQLLQGGLVIPRPLAKGERGRPALTIEEKKERVEEGLMWKKEAGEKNMKNKRGKKLSTKAAIKKASNLAAARKDRFKKEEEKSTYINALTEIRKLCNQYSHSEKA